MKILDTENLEYFYEVEKYRQDFALGKIKNYSFKNNLDTIRELLENPNLDNGIFTLFIDKQNNLFVKVSIVKNFTIYSYYINAFEVYLSQYTTAMYVKNKDLTKKWRKIMKETYLDTKYVEDAQKFLKQELRINQDKLINEFNQENIELL